MSERAAKRGVYLANRPPLGYVRKDKLEPGNGRDGRIVPDIARL